MRLISENSDFQWQLNTMCYILVCSNLEVFQIKKDISYEKAYRIAKNGGGKILAVWPGNWRSDAFLVDDLEQFALEFGCVKPSLPIEIVEYKHLKEYDGRNLYYIDFVVKSDKDMLLLERNFLERFADEIMRKFGWKVALSKGYGSQHDTNSKKWVIGVSVWKMHGKEILNHWKSSMDSCV